MILFLYVLVSSTWWYFLCTYVSSTWWYFFFMYLYLQPDNTFSLCTCIFNLMILLFMYSYLQPDDIFSLCTCIFNLMILFFMYLYLLPDDTFYVLMYLQPDDTFSLCTFIFNLMILFLYVLLYSTWWYFLCTCIFNLMILFSLCTCIFNQMTLFSLCTCIFNLMILFMYLYLQPDDTFFFMYLYLQLDDTFLYVLVSSALWYFSLCTFIFNLMILSLFVRVSLPDDGRMNDRHMYKIIINERTVFVCCVVLCCVVLCGLECYSLTSTAEWLCPHCSQSISFQWIALHMCPVELHGFTQSLHYMLRHNSSTTQSPFPRHTSQLTHQNIHVAAAQYAFRHPCYEQSITKAYRRFSRAPCDLLAVWLFELRWLAKHYSLASTDRRQLCQSQ